MRTQTEFSIFCLSQTCFFSANLYCYKGNKRLNQKFESPLCLPPHPHASPSSSTLSCQVDLLLLPQSLSWCNLVPSPGEYCSDLLPVLHTWPISFIWHHLRPPPSLTLCILLVWSNTSHVTPLLKPSTVLPRLNYKLTGMACRDLHEWFASSITASIYLLSYTPFPNLHLDPQAILNPLRLSERAFVSSSLHVLAGAGPSARNVTPVSYFLANVCSFFRSLIKCFLTCEIFQTSQRQFGVACVPSILQR